MSLFFTKTPLRITFFGGGTDYPSYFSRKPGKTLGAAINKFTYVGIRDLSPIDEYKFRLSYKESEQVNNVVDIKQPVMREVLKMVGDEDRPNEIHYFSDLPSASGLGTSSSFCWSFECTLCKTRNSKIKKKSCRAGFLLSRVKNLKRQLAFKISLPLQLVVF